MIVFGKSVATSALSSRIGNFAPVTCSSVSASQSTAVFSSSVGCAGVEGRKHITEANSPRRIEREASVFRLDPDGKRWECLATGGEWLHLRMCQSCGQVGCCDNSPGLHATAHFQSTRHPLIRSFEPGEEWFWCYLDEVAFELGLPPGPSHP